MRIRHFGEYDAFLRPHTLCSEGEEQGAAGAGGAGAGGGAGAAGAGAAGAGAGAPKPGEKKKFLGKFDTEEAALEAMTNLERRLTDQSGDIEFLQTELEKRPVPKAHERAEEENPFALTKDEETNLRTAPGKVLEVYGRRIYGKLMNDLAKGSNRQQAVARYGQAIHTAFYKDNPDLVGRELIVEAVSNRVQSENPGAAPHQLLGRVAERVRKELETLGVKPAQRGTRSEDDTTRGNTQGDKRTPGQKELDKTLSIGR